MQYFVLISSQPLFTAEVNSGTGKFLFTKVSDASLVKLLSVENSKRITWSVRIVKRVLPDTTNAFGFAIGLYACDNKVEEVIKANARQK